MGLGIAQENMYRGPCYLHQGPALNYRLQEILSPSIPFLLVDHIIQRCEELDIMSFKVIPGAFVS